jgi:hypothetical protein
MFQHLHSIPRLPHALVGQGVRLYGLNLMHHHSADTLQHHATVLFIAEALHPEAPGAALVVKLRFRQPMAPLLNPDHALWSEHIAPHIDEALRIVKQPQPAVSLGGLLVQATTLVHTQPQLISGGGCVVLPKLLPPEPTALSNRQPNVSSPPKFSSAEFDTWRRAA